MRFLLALVVLFGGHVDQSEAVDLIELNHFTVESYSFSQLIFWEFSPDKKCHVVRDWILASAIVSHPCKLNGGHECSVEVEGRKYKVRSKLFRETFTNYDPEMRNRKLHHESLRNVMPWQHCEREGRSEVTGGLNP